MSNNTQQTRRGFKIIDEVRTPVYHDQLERKKTGKYNKDGFLKKIYDFCSIPFIKIKNLISNLIKNNFSVNRKIPNIRILLIVTTIYLLIEFSFSAWLIDVMASLSDPDTIDRAQHYGKLISGFAVALLFWPWFLSRKHWIWKFLGVILGTYLIVGFVYNLEGRMIKHLVDNSSDAQRNAAHIGYLMQETLISNQIKDDTLSGLWTSEISKSTPGKAFAGISAFIVSSSETATKESLEILPDYLQKTIESKMGGLDGEIETFNKSKDIIDEMYLNFDAASNKYNTEIKNIENRAETEWMNYLFRLEKQNSNWGRKHINKYGYPAPKKHFNTIRKNVQASGIPVPNNWNPGNKNVFKNAIINPYKNQALQEFKNSFNGMSPNLNKTQFSLNKDIQSKWKAILQYPNNVGILPINNISKVSFQQNIYNKTIAYRVTESHNAIKQYIKDQHNQKTASNEGKFAYEAMIAPVFALSLSLLGAMVHSCKVLFLLIHNTTGFYIRKPILKSLIIMILIGAMLVSASLAIKTSLTSHETYVNWVKHDEIKNISNTPKIAIGFALDSVIKSQTVAYPVFNNTRKLFEPIFETSYGHKTLDYLSKLRKN